MYSLISNYYACLILFLSASIFLYVSIIMTKFWFCSKFSSQMQNSVSALKKSGWYDLEVGCNACHALNLTFWDGEPTRSIEMKSPTSRLVGLRNKVFYCTGMYRQKFALIQQWNPNERLQLILQKLPYTQRFRCTIEIKFLTGTALITLIIIFVLEV